MRFSERFEQIFLQNKIDCPHSQRTNSDPVMSSVNGLAGRICLLRQDRSCGMLCLVYWCITLGMTTIAQATHFNHGFIMRNRSFTHTSRTCGHISQYTTLQWPDFSCTAAWHKTLLGMPLLFGKTDLSRSKDILVVCRACRADLGLHHKRQLHFV